ncbi:MAG: hypothetical protein DUD32_04530 [Lactobacillus sp.]|nr:MAG: hypothetical protein DUD32_04530 [Lactobacillus sp.]
MNPEDLEKIIGEVNENIYKSDLTPEKIEERVKDYEDENGQVEITKMLRFVMQESHDYTSIFAHDLILHLADEGYLVDPKKNQ